MHKAISMKKKASLKKVLLLSALFGISSLTPSLCASDVPQTLKVYNNQNEASAAIKSYESSDAIDSFGFAFALGACVENSAIQTLDDNASASDAYKAAQSLLTYAVQNIDSSVYKKLSNSLKNRNGATKIGDGFTLVPVLERALYHLENSIGKTFVGDPSKIAKAYIELLRFQIRVIANHYGHVDLTNYKIDPSDPKNLNLPKTKRYINEILNPFIHRIISTYHVGLLKFLNKSETTSSASASSTQNQDSKTYQEFMGKIFKWMYNGEFIIPSTKYEDSVSKNSVQKNHSYILDGIIKIIAFKLHNLDDTKLFSQEKKINLNAYERVLGVYYDKFIREKIEKYKKDHIKKPIIPIKNKIDVNNLMNSLEVIDIKDKNNSIEKMKTLINKKKYDAGYKKLAREKSLKLLSEIKNLQKNIDLKEYLSQVYFLFLMKNIMILKSGNPNFTLKDYFKDYYKAKEIINNGKTKNYEEPKNIFKFTKEQKDEIINISNSITKEDIEGSFDNTESFKKQLKNYIEEMKTDGFLMNIQSMSSKNGSKNVKSILEKINQYKKSYFDYKKSEEYKEPKKYFDTVDMIKNIKEKLFENDDQIKVYTMSLMYDEFLKKYLNNDPYKIIENFIPEEKNKLFNNILIYLDEENFVGYEGKKMNFIGKKIKNKENIVKVKEVLENYKKYYKNINSENFENINFKALFNLLRPIYSIFQKDSYITDHHSNVDFIKKHIPNIMEKIEEIYNYMLVMGFKEEEISELQQYMEYCNAFQIIYKKENHDDDDDDDDDGEAEARNIVSLKKSGGKEVYKEEKDSSEKEIKKLEKEDEKLLSWNYKIKDIKIDKETIVNKLKKECMIEKIKKIKNDNIDIGIDIDMEYVKQKIKERKNISDTYVILANNSYKEILKENGTRFKNDDDFLEYSGKFKIDYAKETRFEGDIKNISMLILGTSALKEPKNKKKILEFYLNKKIIKNNILNTKNISEIIQYEHAKRIFKNRTKEVISFAEEYELQEKVDARDHIAITSFNEITKEKEKKIEINQLKSRKKY
jgi:hypothetical protein